MYIIAISVTFFNWDVTRDASRLKKVSLEVKGEKENGFSNSENLYHTTISIISGVPFWFIYSFAKINKANILHFYLIDFLIFIEIKLNFFLLL